MGVIISVRVSNGSITGDADLRAELLATFLAANLLLLELHSKLVVFVSYFYNCDYLHCQTTSLPLKLTGVILVRVDDFYRAVFLWKCLYLVSS